MKSSTPKYSIGSEVLYTGRRWDFGSGPLIVDGIVEHSSQGFLYTVRPTDSGALTLRMILTEDVLVVYSELGEILYL